MSPEDREARLSEIDRVRGLARKAGRRAVALETAFWAELRATTTPCEPTRHDVEQIAGNVFTVYRCRRCGDEEWL
jgi:hypothetical protein